MHGASVDSEQLAALTEAAVPSSAPRERMGRRERREAKARLREQQRDARRRREEIEREAAEIEASAPAAGDAPAPPARTRHDAAAAGPDAAIAAALPRTAAAMPSERGVRAVPTDTDGLRRVRRAFEEDMAAAAGAAPEAAARGKRLGRARTRDLRGMVREHDKELARRTERQRKGRAAARGVFDHIGFDLMFVDGLAEVEEGLWSETMEFADISYQSAREDEQRGIFDALATLLDFFDSDTMVQYTITNTPLLEDEIGRRRFFDPDACGANAPLARAYNMILNEKMLAGSNNVRRGHYISYAVQAPDPVEASAALSRIRSAVRQTFTRLGSPTHLLNGAERLELVNSLTRPGRPFVFDYERDLSGRAGMRAKDAVCPMSMDFLPDGRDSTRFLVDGRTWCQVLVARPNFGSSLYDDCLSNILDIKAPMAITWHLQPIDRATAVTLLLQRDDWLQAETMSNQTRAIRKGYDYSILPRRLRDDIDSNSNVLEQVVHDGQDLLYFTLLVYTYADTPEQLDAQVVEIVRTAHANGIELDALAARQQEGLNSVLPMAHNHVNVVRDVTTSEVTCLVPFVTQRLDMEGGGYYGQGPVTGDMLIVNRKHLLSPHGFVCGVTGSGKSFAVKREIENTILSYPDDQVFIMDSTGEYDYQVFMNDGAECVRLGPSARSHVNIFDMGDLDKGGLSWQSSVAWKVDAMLAATAALRSEGDQQLTQEERSVVARCVEQAYRDKGGERGEAPLLEDFHRILKAQPEPEAQRLALVFERYISGSMDYMNHPADVDMASRIISFNSYDVPGDMRVFTMLANLETVRAAMYRNYARGVSTWLYIDEFQSLFGHPSVVSYIARLWREGRKYGLICTGMTQSAADMARHEEAKTIVDQSGFFLLLRQSDADREFWVARKGLSDVEESAIDSRADRGSGLLIADGARVPFVDQFPKDNPLWDMFNTSPEEAAAKIAALEAAGTAAE